MLGSTFVCHLNCAVRLNKIGTKNTPELELELELTQTRMTQKPVLWAEVGARAWRRKSSE